MIAFGKVVDELRRLGREFPDRKASCSLFGADGKTPVCIVGHAFVNLGVEIEAEVGSNANLITPAGRVIGHATDTIDGMQFKNLGLRQPTNKQLRWAAEVQSAQDSGYSWGEAVKSADEEARFPVEVDA